MEQATDLMGKIQTSFQSLNNLLSKATVISTATGCQIEAGLKHQPPDLTTCDKVLFKLLQHPYQLTPVSNNSHGFCVTSQPSKSGA